MRAPSTRTRRLVGLSTAPVAILLAGAMVWQGSNAAFTADTRSIGNGWETGSLAISDDDGGHAMFEVINIIPGQTGQKCIAVTATSPNLSTIKLYTGDAGLDGLEQYVKLTIEEGTGGGGFSGCGDFIAENPVNKETSQPLGTLATQHSSWDNAILPWTLSPGTTTKTYKFDWVFDTGTSMSEAEVNALQGKAVSINFEWELQNN